MKDELKGRIFTDGNEDLAAIEEENLDDVKHPITPRTRSPRSEDGSCNKEDPDSSLDHSPNYFGTSPAAREADFSKNANLGTQRAKQEQRSSSDYAKEEDSLSNSYFKDMRKDNTVNEGEIKDIT